ncbi:ribosome recycling factor domain-containing protein [Stachybotrys elegans]|uniref:Ribosome recycling factor domain-containing protein n=1 Tax=Stachybotrys elegans TaxID=80388 RepID=A0A8K0SRV2_9HYPO|nr:ribosome recycling factor domain-containing protein [Stachybotrys elegans]
MASRVGASAVQKACKALSSPRPWLRSTSSRVALPAATQNAARAITPIGARPLSYTASLNKKRKPEASSAPPSKGSSRPPHDSSSSPPSSSSSSKGPAADPENPLDFSSVTAAFAPIDAHFKSQLQALLHGGRFNPASLGALPVNIKDDDGQMVAFPLRELAQVVPRGGRTISLLLNDREYVKPIMSAVQASPDFNQQPQRSEDNELELLLKVEMERKEEVSRRAKEIGQAWRERIRHARAKHDKTLKDWRKTGAVLPDMIKKAEKELQKVQDKKMKDIDQEEAQTIKSIERNSV